jgi:hypothetical protein
MVLIIVGPSFFWRWIWVFQAGLRVEKKGRTKYEDPWRWGHEVLYWDKAVRKGVWEPFACRPLRFASIDRAFPLESVVGGSLKETRYPKWEESSGERKRKNKLFKEDNPFSVYRLLGVNLQEEAAEGTVQLPRLLPTPQARSARLLPPISMDQKGKR